MAQLIAGCAQPRGGTPPGRFHVRHPNFDRFLRPLFSLTEARHHTRIVGLFWGLTLYRDTILPAAVARLLATDGGRYSIDWCALATKVMPNRRIDFLEAVAQANLAAMPFESRYADLLLQIQDIAPRKYFRNWLAHALAGLMAGIDHNYLLRGFQLAREFYPTFYFGNLGNCRDFSSAAFDACIAQIKKSPGFYGSSPCLLWRRCGELPGLSRLLGRVEWNRLKPRQAEKFLQLLYSMLSGNCAPARLPFLERSFAAVCEVVYSVPAMYRIKAIGLLDDYYWYFDDSKDISAYHADFLSAVRTLCRPPFSAENHLGTLWCVLQAYGLLGNAAGMLNTEKFCRSQNTAWLVQRGIRPLVKVLGEYAISLLRAGNPRMLAAAKLLGCLDRRQRYDVLAAVRSCALMTLRISPENLKTALEMIDAHRLGKMHNPVPRKLRASIRGEIRLSDKALAGRLADLEANLVYFKLHFIAHRIVDSVRRHYGFVSRENLDHALLITNLVRENRRALRRFLAAYAAGENDYILRHPASQFWLKKAAPFHRGVWFEGIEIRVADEALGEIRIAVERDPLEKLKLGTYVNSCLGLGGGFMYSAAAVVLDVNKQVVYARDYKGRVVARQLVCLSDQGKLVPFAVYPVGASAAMQAHFAAFDRKFAAALGIACHDSGDGTDYHIANILSHHWFDDGAWDMKMDAP